MNKSLAPGQLYQTCDPSSLPFTTTDEVSDVVGIIGQQRAIEALQFAVDIRRDGYNLFVLGPAGMGKHTMVKRYLEGKARDEATPQDWCYVHRFDQPQQPRAISLPPGEGMNFRHAMERLVDDLQSAIPLAFETEEYHSRVEEVEQAFKKLREKTFGELADEAASYNITLMRTAEGFSFAPMKDGKILEAEEYQALAEHEREEYERVIRMLQEKLNNIIHQVPQWQREMRERIRTINRDVGMFAVEHLVDEVKSAYRDHPEILAYLDDVQQDVLGHLNDFLGNDEMASALRSGTRGEESFRRYRVNVLVSHNDGRGAPVIYEDSPLHQNMVGCVEHIAQMGALVTDFLLIKPGALHKANGGYLIIDAHKLLMQPYAWEGLKRALRSRSICIESLAKIYSLISTQSLEPDPIPLDIKVVLLGDRMLYYLLMAYDPEFQELFKVPADFEDSMDYSPENVALYASMIATLVRKEELLPFASEAVARVIEQGQRIVSDQDKITSHMLSIVDLLRESDHWARQGEAAVVSRDHVQKAIEMQIYRHDRLRENIHEAIRKDVILIDSDGQKTGQVNGLFVVEMGNFSFAQPGRISATVRMGEGDIIDIEREVELGGSIHSKGVMILSSLIGARYARTRPLSLTANLVFEQSYGMVEGDSASAGECAALLSAIASVPVQQSLAITGSVNQHGEIQAIGAVNEKIEGFFDICSARGLNGSQGVIIPAANVRHLMLRSDVVAAVAGGRFAIHAVSTIDEALSLLTGIDAGVQDEQGNYPEGSLNRRVADALADMAEVRHEFTTPGKVGAGDGQSDGSEDQGESD